ncbi:MAG: aldo/keto reductase [Pseudomonadota bacterium]
MHRRRLLGGALAALGAYAAGPASAVISRPMGTSGQSLPVIGMGTWQTFDVPPNDPSLTQLRQVLSAFYEGGGRMVDTSPMYGRSEAMLGSIARQLKISDELFYATKVWTEGKDAGERQMDTSAKLLHRQTIDLMQVHNLLDLRTQLASIRQRRELGRIRYVGVTHYQSSAHQRLAQVLRDETLDFVQVNYSVVNPAAAETVFPVAADRGVAVIVNRPFEGGAVFRRLASLPLPPWAQEYECASWPELMLKYVVGHEAVTVAIPATSNPDHMAQNIRACQGEAVTGQRRRKLGEQLRRALDG